MARCRALRVLAFLCLGPGSWFLLFDVVAPNLARYRIDLGLSTALLNSFLVLWAVGHCVLIWWILFCLVGRSRQGNPTCVSDKTEQSSP